MADIPKWTKLLSGAAKFLPEAPWVALVVELVSHLTSAMGVTSSDSKETLNRIESLRAELHSNLTQVSAAHTGLATQLAAQSDALAQHRESSDLRLDELRRELSLTRQATESFERRIAALDARSVRTLTLAITGCALTAACLILLIVVLLRRH